MSTGQSNLLWPYYHTKNVWVSLKGLSQVIHTTELSYHVGCAALVNSLKIFQRNKFHVGTLPKPGELTLFSWDVNFNITGADSIKNTTYVWTQKILYNILGAMY